MDSYTKRLLSVFEESAWQAPSTEFPLQKALDNLLEEKAKFDASVKSNVKQEYANMLKKKYGCSNPEAVVSEWVQMVKPKIKSITYGCTLSVYVIDDRPTQYGSHYTGLDNLLGWHPGAHPGFPSKQEADRVRPTELESLCLMYCGYKVCIDDEPARISWGN